jgi:hypothetical protein
MQRIVEASTLGWAEVRSPSIANDGLSSSAHPMGLPNLRPSFIATSQTLRQIHFFSPARFLRKIDPERGGMRKTPVLIGDKKIKKGRGTATLQSFNSLRAVSFLIDKKIFGAPERIRTSDLSLRRAALYPAELRAL